MKRKITFFTMVLWMILLVQTADVHAQQTMHIYLNNGSEMQFSLADIQKLTFDQTTGNQINPEIMEPLLRLKLFPNPAADNFTIEYSLSAIGHVLIKIFKPDGTLVSLYDKGIQTAGTYRYGFKTMMLPTGTYLCLIQQNNKIVTEKLIIIK